ncbi:MAG: SpoIID/LytB domain-containing protein [Oscillospiraceae bacterium]
MKILKKIIAALSVLALSIISVPLSSGAEFIPYVDTVKIGLFYGSSALVSANLQNVTGIGSGYEFGYFNSDREFVPIEASVSVTKISMLKDINQYYSASENSYYEGTNGSVIVGCFHIQLDKTYDTYDEARAAADTFTSVTAFPRYCEGCFYVCAGAYTTRADAATAAASLGIQSAYSITCGTSYTVTVVETGTSKILFEFDCGSSISLAVRPLSDDSGIKTQTWFKGYKYYGSFQYARLSGEDLTVVNFVGLEDYVKGVIPYEMSASWPIEALKAQAVCARTYVMSHLNAHKSNGFDLCNTVDCQVYRGTTSATANSDSAVDDTEGQYLMYDGTLCETYYSSSDGGASESSENVWPNARGYLIGKEDPYEAAVINKIANYNWTVTYTANQLTAKLQNKGYSCSTITKFEIVEFTPTGNVYKIKFTDVNGKTFTFSKEYVRTVLGLRSPRYAVNGDTADSRDVTLYVNGTSGTTTGSAIPSSYAIGSGGTTKVVVSDDTFCAITGSGTVEAVPTQKGSSASAEDTFVISGSGYGHNVGMSQWGAYSMASVYDLSYTDILTFYYTGTDIVTA